MTRNVYISRLCPEMHFWSLRQKTGNNFARLLFETLTAYADSQGYCRLPLSFLAEQFNRSKKTIERKLLSLESKGFISVRPIDGDLNLITIIGYADELKKILNRNISYEHTCTSPSQMSGGQA